MAIDSSKADGAKPAALHLSLRDTDGIVREFGEFTASGPAVLLYVRGAWCPFCLRQLSDYGEQYREFKQSGLEVFAVSPESPRRSRRLRRGLKLPFTVLSDSRLEAAKHLDLIGHEKPGAPTPATLVLDGKHGVRLSSMNQGPKCLFARDVLEYMRMGPLDAPQHIPPPSVEMPKPGFLFMRGLANMFAGIVIR